MSALALGLLDRTPGHLAVRPAAAALPGGFDPLLRAQGGALAMGVTIRERTP